MLPTDSNGILQQFGVKPNVTSTHQKKDSGSGGMFQLPPRLTLGQSTSKDNLNVVGDETMMNITTVHSSFSVAEADLDPPSSSIPTTNTGGGASIHKNVTISSLTPKTSLYSPNGPVASQRFSISHGTTATTGAERRMSIQPGGLKKHSLIPTPTGSSPSPPDKGLIVADQSSYHVPQMPLSARNATRPRTSPYSSASGSGSPNVRAARRMSMGSAVTPTTPAIKRAASPNMKVMNDQDIWGTIEGMMSGPMSARNIRRVDKDREMLLATSTPRRNSSGLQNQQAVLRRISIRSPRIVGAGGRASPSAFAVVQTQTYRPTLTTWLKQNVIPGSGGESPPMAEGDETGTSPTIPAPPPQSATNKVSRLRGMPFGGPLATQRNAVQQAKEQRRKRNEEALQLAEKKYLVMACNKIGVWYTMLLARREMRRKYALLAIQARRHRRMVHDQIRKWIRKWKLRRMMLRMSRESLDSLRRGERCILAWWCRRRWLRVLRPQLVVLREKERNRRLRQQRRYHAAVRIQSWFRMLKQQRVYGRVMVLRKRHAAKKLQQWWNWSVYLKSVRGRLMKERLESQASALKLQKVFRGFLGRKLASYEKMVQRVHHVR